MLDWGNKNGVETKENAIESIKFKHGLWTEKQYYISDKFPDLYHCTLLLKWWFLFHGAGDWTKGLGHARQVFNCWAIPPDQVMIPDARKYTLKQKSMRSPTYFQVFRGKNAHIDRKWWMNESK